MTDHISPPHGAQSTASAPSRCTPAAIWSLPIPSLPFCPDFPSLPSRPPQQAICLQLSCEIGYVMRPARTLVALAVLYAALSGAALPSVANEAILNSTPPDGRLRLEIVAPLRSTAGHISLFSVTTSETLSSIKLTTAPIASTCLVVWNADSSAVAARLVLTKTESHVFAFLKTRNGAFKNADATYFTGNWGKLGEPLGHWKRIEDQPIEWTDHPNAGARFLLIRTHFWDKRGKRYTAGENVYFSPDGEPMER
jgi:hypothetical protein